jgi:hypothetical protein
MTKPHLVLVSLLGATGLASPVHAQAGTNEACAAEAVAADDTRESYDDHGKLTQQLRISKGQVVADARIAYDESGHPTERTEATAGHTKVARTNWQGDKVVEAACSVDGVVTARIVYEYDGDRLVSKAELKNGQAPRTTTLRYDEFGHLLLSETRSSTGEIVSRTEATYEPPRTPVQVTATAGGAYQSDTELIDASAGLGIHRRPPIERYGSDPIEVMLDGAFKFNRAKGITNTDQLTARLAVDYNYVLPRVTLFTFTRTDRNLPANLKLNLEEAFLGLKVDIVPRAPWMLDASVAPVWNFRSIIAPVAAGTPATVDETTSALRASFRLRLGYRTKAYGLNDMVEFLPLVVGDTPVVESDVWSRSIFRNTVSFDVSLSNVVTFHQELKYTRDLSMRAQAVCPNSSSSLCGGYAVASVTALSLKLDLVP